MADRSNTAHDSKPEWVKDAVFYQIFPDRFARSESLSKPANLLSWHSAPTERGYHGGDLHGIVEHLDYLVELGITAIYLTPIFQSACNHRYHTHDYRTVDPLLGGNEALRALVTAAHDRDIRVVLDGVFNHASRGFYQFHHAMENGAASPYLDWFHFDEERLRAWVAELGWEALLNRRGMMWRKLPDDVKENIDASSAFKVMMETPRAS